MAMAGFAVLAWTSSGYCGLQSVQIQVLKSPATFYTGRNVGPGDIRITIDTTAPGDGLETGTAVQLDLVPTGGDCASATALTNDLSTSTLEFPVGDTDYFPIFHPLRPFTGGAVRFKVTVSSTANDQVIGTACSSEIDIFDYERSSIEILQNPPIFVVNSTTTVMNPTGLKLFVVSTNSSNNFGLEDWMRVSFSLVAGTTTIADSASSISPSLTIGSTFYFPAFYPKYSSGGSQNLRFQVTITSADATILIPRLGENPSVSTLVGVSPGEPSRLVLLPQGDRLVRPSTLGRAHTYDIDNPKAWTPVALGAPLPIQVILTDSWSNPVDVVPDTNFVVFESATFLEVHEANNSGGLTDWLLDSGYNGTRFEVNMVPWEIPVPVTVTSSDGYTSDTIYVSKAGLPRDTIFAGPSPFNPMNQPIRFGFRVSEDKTVKILVLDIFGRKVWDTSIQATAGFLNTAALWDGRNGNGDIVAAGVYWVVLEVDGDWKSKKKFGVIK